MGSHESEQHKSTSRLRDVNNNLDFSHNSNSRASRRPEENPPRPLPRAAITGIITARRLPEHGPPRSPMRPRTLLAGCLLATLPALSLLTAADNQAPDKAKAPASIGWKKTVVDRTFLSEGVTVADVNKDGKLDILNGEAWYEAPDWKKHDIRKLGDYKDGLGGYSNSFACWAEDINGDGYPDLIVIGFPGAPCHWFENPKGKDGHWKQHEIWHSACNETPQYVDLLGNGKRVLLMGWQPKDSKGNMGQMAYFTPGEDPTKPWTMHPISVESAPGKEVPGTQRFSHGLGVGDVNGDGRLDVICTGGWWERPDEPDGKTRWQFQPG